MLCILYDLWLTMYSVIIAMVYDIYWIIVLIMTALIISVISKTFCIRPKSIKGKHVVITGGSSGIGKALGVLAAQLGANVTIIARNLETLNSAATEIQKACVDDSQNINVVCLDVSVYDDLKQQLTRLEDSDPIYMLINCAGLALCGEVENLSPNDIETMTKVNFLGSVYSTQIVLPKMKLREEGIIVFTASQAACVGIYGMSVYSGTKFGLRGFGEAVDMEVKPYNITVTVALPPDTDTPGYHTENIRKPLETKLISESGGLYEPKDVAKKIMDDALKGFFFSSVGMEGFLLTNLCAGMSKCSSAFDLLMQVFLLGIFRGIGVCFRGNFNQIIKNCLKMKNKSK